MGLGERLDDAVDQGPVGQAVGGHGVAFGEVWAVENIHRHAVPHLVRSAGDGDPFIIGAGEVAVGANLAGSGAFSPSHNAEFIICWSRFIKNSEYRLEKRHVDDLAPAGGLGDAQRHQTSPKATP